MANRIYSVSEVNGYVSRTLQMDPLTRDIMIRGEVSNARRYASGHWYFTLKDDSSALRCVWFLQNQKESFAPGEGQRVVVQGALGIYLRDGQYQLAVSRIRADGVGSWYERFEQLKAQCMSRGWFDEERKRPLPAFPRVIGIVTSADGAALRDIIRVAHRRMPWVELLLCPVLVQGDSAAAQIAGAIASLGGSGQCDVIITGRGGGSIEDLWAFNEMSVVQAIAECPVPVISAVGHQTDFTLADFAADVRAATPSMAAELATCDGEELRNRLRGLSERLDRAAQGHVRTLRYGLEQLAQRLDQATPAQKLADARLRLDRLAQRLDPAMERILDSGRERLHHCAQMLEAMSPRAVTARGYALVYGERGLVTHVGAVSRGDRLILALAGGRIEATADQIMAEDA